MAAIYPCKTPLKAFKGTGSRLCFFSHHTQNTNWQKKRTIPQKELVQQHNVYKIQRLKKRNKISIIFILRKITYFCSLLIIISGRFTWKIQTTTIKNSKISYIQVNISSRKNSENALFTIVISQKVPLKIALSTRVISTIVIYH